ncbi:MAG: hypothetical protein GY821_02785 [Gammaproteobacteria bacterium]|nr:hypothetical protein [Gammaproteobacteria bacterium]
MQLLHNVGRELRGDFTVKMVMTTGNASLEMQIDGEGFHTIPDTTQTSTTSFDLTGLGVCDVRAVITGDATVHIAQSSNVPI